MSEDAEFPPGGPSWGRRSTDREEEPEAAAQEEAQPSPPDDDAIRTLVTRLARRHPSGGTVIERAAILAEGADCTAVIAWIEARDGKPEAAVARTRGGGLHGSRLSNTAQQADGGVPRRYVLPPGALN